MAERRTNILIGAVLLTGCLAFFAPHAHAEPVTLDDGVLDRVTAGETTEGGGVIIGNSSDAVANRTTGLDLSGEAQQGARGLNLVNSAESAVANTVNIWDGSAVTITIEDGDTKPVLEVNQINQITQEQNQSATMSGYLRSEADQAEASNRFVSENNSSDIVNSNNTTALFEEIRHTKRTDYSEVDTSLKFKIDDNMYFEGNFGQGVAASGEVKAKYDGGEAEIVLGVNAGFDADVGFHHDGLFQTSLDFEAGIGVDAGLTLTTKIELPELKIKFSGAGYGVVLGSCKAYGNSEETIITATDNSTLDIQDLHETGQNSYIEVQTSIHRSPFELKSAKAEYIVIDDSSLELDSDVTLELSDSAQKDIEGMNIVNAIGSNVANAVNVSRATKFKSRRATLVLNQFNIVFHGR
jgi:hypothetical protein